MKFSLFVFVTCLASAESLHYSVNWQSGLSLGEATIGSEHSQPEKGPETWRSTVDIDASVPGFVIRDHYNSSAAAGLCSVQLDKSSTHGKKKSEEKITFDQQKNTITRETASGGKSDTSVSSCARDALTFLQFVRRELAQGRIAADQKVVFGALYQVHIDYKGAQTIKVGEKSMETDRTLVSIKGPSTEVTAEIFFARDAARTPVLARIPLTLGTFTVELQP
jgi:Protein of unknown function (DUF3108)